MSKKEFTKQQQENLINNKYVLKVSEKHIDFTFEFKEHIVLCCSTFTEGLKYFEENNLGIEILGHKRIEQCFYRWKRQFKEHGNVKFILEERGKGKGLYTPGTDEFSTLSVELQNEILLKELERERQDNVLLKKYMPSLDGSKVKKD